MDLSSASIRPHGKLSQKEKNRRRNLGLCKYCGSFGHVVRNCHLKPTQAPLAVKTANMGSNIEESSGKA